MDCAALRRFNYKIEFGYLKPDGVVTFYKKILLPLIGFDLEKGLEDELGVQGLTPEISRWLKASSSSGQPIKYRTVL
ncbi:MAG: hypothetical protein ACLQPD_06620 [Desulfomonilaceae bacterium]